MPSRRALRTSARHGQETRCSPAPPRGLIGGQRVVDHFGDPPRPRGHDHDLGREINGLGDGMRDKQHGFLGGPPQVEQLVIRAGPARSHPARRKGSSISSNSASKAKARAIDARCCMPPDSCHGYLVPKAVQLHHFQHGCDALVCGHALDPAPSGPAAGGHVPLNRPPGQQAGLLENIAVGALCIRASSGLRDP